MKFETIDVWGFDGAMTGMRNPLKSYHKADSIWTVNETDTDEIYEIGPNDYKLAKSLGKGGPEHRKWMRMVWVGVDITAPRYWWSEFDTYKVGIAANSESTMHTLLKEDFSRDQFEWPTFEGKDGDLEAVLKDYINNLKMARDRANAAPEEKEYYHKILKSMLPESFLQKRTVCLNYEVLANMYKQRKHHRLPQGNKYFVEWVNTLPYSEFITGDFD